jgi:hypothetical protein
MKENETSMQKSKVIRNQSTQNNLDRIRSDLKTQTPIQFLLNKNKNETQNTKSFKGQTTNFQQAQKQKAAGKCKVLKKARYSQKAMYSEKQSTQKSGARFSKPKKTQRAQKSKVLRSKKTIKSKQITIAN